MQYKLSKSDWIEIGQKTGWLKKTAGFGDMAKGLLELGKDMLGGRSKTVNGSALSPYMPTLMLNGDGIEPMLYKVDVTVRKFVPGSPDESDYSITVVEASSPKARWLSLSPHTVSIKDLGKMDDQLQEWISEHKELVHGWVSRLIDKETNGGGSRFRGAKT